MLLVFPMAIAAMFVSAAFMPVDNGKKVSQPSQNSTFLECKHSSGICSPIKKEEICEQGFRDRN